MLVTVVVSLTAYRRVTYDIKICPWLNVDMITITTTSVYHGNVVLRLQVIAFNVTNAIA